MATKEMFRVKKGIKLDKEASDVTYNEKTEGGLYNKNNEKIKAHIQGADREVVTADQTQTVTNKTIDVDNNTVSNIEVDNLKAGVLDTDLTSVSASDDTIPSAKATKTALDLKATDADLTTHIADTTTHGTTGDIVGTSDSQTLTNKTIDVDSNTVSNIEVDNLKAGVLDTDLTSVSASDDTIPSAKATKTALDLKATAADLSAHTGASSGVHGATGDVVGTSDSQTLTNKIISGNTAANLSPDGVETLTLPVATDTLVGKATTDTLTNKTIDADNNTISNLAHGAEVDNPSSGVHGATGNIVGTSDSQTLTNKTIDGDNNTISNLAHGSEVDNPSSGVHGVTGSVVGTSDSQTLTNKTLTSAVLNTAVSGTAVLDEDDMASDSATQLATQQSIKKYVDDSVVAGGGYNQSDLLSDVGLNISMAANAVTVALKRADGSTDGSVSNPIKIGFRHGTITTGGFNVRSITSSLSMTIDSGATLGTTSAKAERIYIYALDNSGTVELAASKFKFKENELHSTTLLDSSADDAYTMYSDTARSSLPIKLLGSFVSTQATAGTWATAATEIYIGDKEVETVAISYDTDSGGALPDSSTSVVDFDSTTNGYDTAGAVTTGWFFTTPVSGKYHASAYIQFQDSGAWGAGEIAYLDLYKNGSLIRRLDYQEIQAAGTFVIGLGGSTTLHLNVGDTVDFRVYQNIGGALPLETSEELNWCTIERVGC